MNALYSVEWVSPNGAVSGTDEVAASSDTHARLVVQSHRGEHYAVSTGELLRDLNETTERDAKYQRAKWLREVSVR